MYYRGRRHDVCKADSQPIDSQQLQFQRLGTGAFKHTIYSFNSFNSFNFIDSIDSIDAVNSIIDSSDSVIDSTNSIGAGHTGLSTYGVTSAIVSTGYRQKYL